MRRRRYGNRSGLARRVRKLETHSRAARQSIIVAQDVPWTNTAGAGGVQLYWDLTHPPNWGTNLFGLNGPDLATDKVYMRGINLRYSINAANENDTTGWTIAVIQSTRMTPDSKINAGTGQVTLIENEDYYQNTQGTCYFNKRYWKVLYQKNNVWQYEGQGAPTIFNSTGNRYAMMKTIRLKLPIKIYNPTGVWANNAWQPNYRDYKRTYFVFISNDELLDQETGRLTFSVLTNLVRYGP